MTSRARLFTASLTIAVGAALIAAGAGVPDGVLVGAAAQYIAWHAVAPAADTRGRPRP